MAFSLTARHSDLQLWLYCGQSDWTRTLQSAAIKHRYTLCAVGILLYLSGNFGLQYFTTIPPPPLPRDLEQYILLRQRACVRRDIALTAEMLCGTIKVTLCI